MKTEQTNEPEKKMRKSWCNGITQSNVACGTHVIRTKP